MLMVTTFRRYTCTTMYDYTLAQKKNAPGSEAFVHNIYCFSLKGNL